MRVRREIARKRVPREAYLVSRMQRNRHTLSVLRFTLHEQRFTRKRSGSAIAAETRMSNVGRGDRNDRRRLTMTRLFQHSAIVLLALCPAMVSPLVLAAAEQPDAA